MLASAFLVALAALLVIAIPMFLIMPFRAQPEWAVTLGYSLERAAPLVTLLAALVVIGLVVRGWRAGSWGWTRKGGAVLVVALTGATAWLARQNRFEWMFAPLPNPAFARPAEADWIPAGEMVLAVTVNGESVAYPRSQLAYHHLVQDSVGGVPIVATY
jgi:hypothetical protein